MPAAGRVAWQQTENVFGTWLGYSQARDVLLEAGSAASDRSPDETGKGMAALRVDLDYVLDHQLVV